VTTTTVTSTTSAPTAAGTVATKVETKFVTGEGASGAQEAATPKWYGFDFPFGVYFSEPKETSKTSGFIYFAQQHTWRRN